MKHLLAALIFCAPAPALAQGIAARMLPPAAVEGSPLEVEVEIEDPIRVVGRVRLLVWSRLDGEPLAIEAQRGGAGFVAQLPAELVPVAGQHLWLAAEILGRRGGLLSTLGKDEPLEIVVLSRAEGAKIAAKLGAADKALRGAYVVGIVGVDARAGSSGRVRGLVGASFRVADRVELGALVSVGPAFSPPASSSGRGGPIVLGFEVDPRLYAVLPLLSKVALFVEPTLQADLRLPGLDLGLGLRAGLTLRLARATAVDLAVGGAATVFSLPEAAAFGFEGGVRVAMRFEGSLEDEPP